MKKLTCMLLTIVLLLAMAAPAAAYSTVVKGKGTTISANCNGSCTAVIDANGDLWLYGTGPMIDSLRIEQLRAENPAVPAEELRSSRVPVKALSNVASVSVGADHIGAVKNDGTLWMWGNNGSGQCGIQPGFSVCSKPMKVMDKVVDVSAGNICTAVLKADGTVWTFGSNGDGRLGNGTTTDSYEPRQIMDNVVAISASTPETGTHMAALKVDGSLWTWGENRHGQLGNGTTEDSLFPVKVMEGVASFSTGGRHTAAVKKDGSLWTWGFNYYGELGNGTRESASTPQKVMENVSSVIGGEYRTAVIKTDGSLWAWGMSLLGGGFAAGSLSPVKVMDKVAAVSAPTYMTMAIKTDGSLWVWGETKEDYLGELAMSNETYQSKPVQTVPAKIPGMTAKLPGAVTMAPAGGMAYTSSSTVTVDGRPVDFQLYALRDERGYETNYIKLRDVAYILNGTEAQFNVGWNRAVIIEPGVPYEANGTEMSTPFTGNRPYTVATAPNWYSFLPVDLDAIYLEDDEARGYTYYKLRDLGQLLDFNVGWESGVGIYIETDKPYVG